MPSLITLATRQRKEIDAADASNVEAVARAYALMFDRLEGDVDALTRAIERLDNPSQAEVKRLPEYRRLMRRSEDELDRFENYLEVAIGSAALAAIGYGLAHSQALVNATIGGGFTGLDSGVMRSLLQYLREDGPLYARLKLITDGTIDRVVEQIISGVSLGYNPQKTARLIQDAFGGGLTDAMRNMRTVQIKSYQDSARANYQASGVVEKWIWYAELDADVCMSCASMHGTLHDLDEQLDDHYNGRCAALPYIEGLTEDVASGQTWFDGLSEAEQRAHMGNGKYEAYKEGKFEFSQLSRQQENDVFGTMRTETSLQDLLDNKYFTGVSEPMGDFEDKIIGQKYETAALFSKDGSLLLEKDGSAHEVVFTKNELRQMDRGVLTHNHPTGANFSFDDIGLMAESNLSEIRAVGNEYTFIMKNPVGNIKEEDLYNFWNQSVRDTKALKAENPDMSVKEYNHLQKGIFADYLGLEYERILR